MKSKLNYLIGISFKRKVNSKWFKVVNVLLLLVICLLANIDSIINAFGGDFDKKQELYIIDKTEVSYDLFKQSLMEITSTKEESDLNYNLTNYEGSIEDAKKVIEEHKDYLVIVFEPDEEKTLKVTLMSEEYLDVLDSSYLTNAIYNTKVMLATISSNISPEELAKIYENIEVERIILDDTKTSADESSELIITSVFPVVILPFFILVIYLVQMIGAEINDEKTTKGMEIMISSVSPTTHFFSKVIASNLFVVIQGALMFVYGIIAVYSRNLFGSNKIDNGVIGSIIDMLKTSLSSSFIDKLIYIIPLTLVLMILTFLAYSLVAGILASMTTTPEDFQQIQTPIMIVLLVGYYLATLAGMFDGSIFLKVLSFVPFISAILAPSLLVLGQIGILEVCISIVIMIATIALLIKYGLRVYKVGILNYSSTNLWKKIGSAIKNK